MLSQDQLDIENARLAAVSAKYFGPVDPASVQLFDMETADPAYMAHLESEAERDFQHAAANEQRRLANAPIIAASRQARERVRADDAKWLAGARRWRDRTPEQEAAEERMSRVAGYLAHRTWRRRGEPDLLASWQAKRAAERKAAKSERDAIEKAALKVRTAADSTDAQIEAADAAEQVALAEWNRKHDRWLPNDKKKAAYDAEQKLWAAYQREPSESNAAAVRALATQQRDANAEQARRKALHMSADIVSIHKGTPLTAPTSAALNLTFFNECHGRAPKRWLHKGVFAKGENSSIFGAPGTLKSALLTDLAVHMAAGKDWRGFKSKGWCGVVYFAFERADLVRRRLAAYTTRDGLTDLPIAVAGNLIDMLDPGCVKIIVDTVRAAEARFGIPVGMIGFDTWAKGIAAGGGEENAARDQNIVAANMQRVHEELPGVHVCGIGHSGKDEAKGERGSNARQGDVDLQIQITGGDAIKTATVVKANDQAEGPLVSFAGEVVALGTDEDGDPITAFVLSTRNFEPTPKVAAKLSDRQVLALDALRKTLSKNGTTRDGVQIVEVDTWRDALFAAGVLDADAANPRRDFIQLRDALARKKLIVQHDGWIRLAHFGR